MFRSLAGTCSRSTEQSWQPLFVLATLLQNVSLYEIMGAWYLALYSLHLECSARGLGCSRRRIRCCVAASPAHFRQHQRNTSSAARCPMCSERRETRFLTEPTITCAGYDLLKHVDLPRSNGNGELWSRPTSARFSLFLCSVQARGRALGRRRMEWRHSSPDGQT